MEAETTDTISWGLFLARLNSGDKMIFEQAEVNSGLFWLPKRLVLTGSGRVGLIKRLAQDVEVRMEQLQEVLGGFQDID